MKSAISQEIKTFSLLSIGQRGVGKTVFLAGSYAELNHGEPKQRQLWFECQDSQAQASIERILNYIVQTQQYPPPTIKVTSFSFSLKCRHWGKTRTLCHFDWRDLPGEICQSHNLEFRQLVSSSHGCCVFIDAQALGENPAYPATLTEIIGQVTAIANLVYLNGLNYAFAIILTKSDLIELSSDRQQIEQQLQPLTQSLELARANYQIFYSQIPLVKVAGVSTLQAEGAAMPLVWLVGELCRVHHLWADKLPGLPRLLSKRLPPQQIDNPSTLSCLFNPTGKASAVKQLFGIYLYPSRLKSAGFALLAIAVSAGVVSSMLFDYKQLFLGRVSNVIDWQQPQQLSQTITLLEKLIQQRPKDLELRLQLAQLYEQTGELAKAETVYDQVLAQAASNVYALSRKAILRHAQGDIDQSNALFTKAESAAPNSMKAKIRELAQTTLQQKTE